MEPLIDAKEDGLELIDPIERHRYRIRTSGSIELRSDKRNRIPYPVDSSVIITTGELILPQNEYMYVIDDSGSIIESISSNGSVHLPDGSYTLDISSSMKTYIHINGGVNIYTEKGQSHIDIDEPTQVAIGVRSYHAYPVSTIKTTSNPTDLMNAVSTFGSALKTMRPERSYPTLRGHPPIIKLGDELDIPNNIDQPNTGIKIEIPPTLANVYTVTPLTYYLGAEVVPNSKPQLTTKSGYTYALDEYGELESTIERLLKHVFFLDCIVRTEGLSPEPLYERQAIDSLLEFDIATVYEQSLAKQLKSYLEVPFSLVDSYYFDWYPKATIESSRDMIGFLPFLAKGLSLITVRENENEYLTIDSQIKKGSNNKYINNESSATIQQSWKYDSSSEILCTIPLTAFYNKIDQTPKDNPLEIDIICNESNMREELVSIYGTYGDRDELPFNITIHHDLTTTELKKVLSRESDFVHYIGHIDQKGFRCSDGKLDASLLEAVETKAFFLNACHSYEQGLELVEAGSIGGIVTLDDIQNKYAVRVGSTVARLLNYGYSFSAVLDIVQAKATADGQYHIVGDGTTAIAQSKTGLPGVCSVHETYEDGTVQIDLHFYSKVEKGTMITPDLNSNKYHYLSEKIGPITVTKPELIRFFDLGPIPVLHDGVIDWSDDLRLKDI
ncbi:hypothetical protein [Natronococcus wangiae]|uniref:hypothetical protein n=1 Tax=Natronococcus wangiae TaxID=3068275 RepID=UPI00273EDD03|nr:hypothetical protein [Natronococcus sp. AD5]